MKTSLKRILSLVLVFCLCLTMMPVMTMQVEAAGNATVCGVDMGIALGSHMQFTTASGTNSESGYYYKGYNLYGTQCIGFARWCQYKLFGGHWYNASGEFYNVTVNGVNDIARGSLTTSNLKSMITACKPGAHLRTHPAEGKTWGHSMVITAITDQGFSIVQCNGENNNEYSGWKQNYVGTYTYTWSSYVNSTYGKRGIDYIEMPYNYPYTNGHTTHTYAYHYEAAHPHNEYKKCTVCGIWSYTGAKKTLSSCATCNPVGTSGTYNTVLPFTAYLKADITVYPYTTEHLATQSGGEIWATDECTITAVYSNGACKVKYPVGSSYKEAYTSLSNFIVDTSAGLAKLKVSGEIPTYIQASTSSTQYGHTDPGDEIYIVGYNGNMAQIFYPTPSGYKLAWVRSIDLETPTYDNRFNPYCPIKGYPCATSDFDVYASNYSTYAGEIWTTDYCTINAVYDDGWCQVSYPAGSTTKTAYTKLSNFVYNVSASHVKYTAKAQTTTYKNQSLSADNGWLSAGDVFYVVGTYGSASQVLYPIDAQYGGGYKLGWIYTSSLPKTTYTVSYNANGGIGAPSNQTKTHGVTLKLSTTVPTRTGYAFVGWATSSSATSATYAAGANYSTDANLTLYAVWTLNKYEISYNANGGTNVPATQNKAHGANLTLTTAVPTKNYSITFNANGGSVDAATRQVACKFLGWATSSSAATATYQPGGKFTANENTTLYAVWQNPTLGQYSIPYRAGYVFEGWYTAANGGTKVTSSTVVSFNMTIYAHWTVATYSINYNSNGGENAPAPQTKTHGQKIALSTMVPTREGSVFAGWGTEEDPTMVQYQPGDTYSADNDIMLIAVWEQAALTKIELLTVPTKTTYYVGDVLDTTGLSLKATYSDNSTKTISDGFTCNTTVLNSVGPQTIAVSYNGETVTFTVTVRELPNGAMEVGNVSGEPGEIVTVPVRITDNPGIIAARLKIAYDSTVMTLMEVKDGGILGEYVFGGDLNANPYVVMWENGLATSDYTQTGTLVYLTFQIAEDITDGDYPITVSYDAEEVYNKELVNTVFAIKQGVVTVEEKEIITPDSPQIVLESKVAHCGSTVSVDVKLLNNPGFSVLNVAFLYDSEYLMLTSVENKATSMVMTHNASVLWDSATNYTADGILATLNFVVAEEVPEGDYEIRIIFMGASNEDFEEVKMTGVSGILTVTSVVYGDANGDGQVTTVDLAMLRKYLSNMDPISGTSSVAVKSGADCNGDGKVNTIDLAMLRKYLSSKDPITGESSVVLGPK